MNESSVSPRLAWAAGIGAMVATLALGILLRLVDPLSTPVIPAEDPFSHMVLVTEHLRTGTLDPLNPNGSLYPPGMHAYLGAVWTVAGLDLHQLFRFAPVALGGIGILGMGALLWRQAGPIAGFVGALGYAVAPEVIFRTTMMSPTALDLAVVPFLLYALLEVLEGDLRWLGVAIPTTAFLVFSHPWILGILTVAGGLLVLLSILAPGSTDAGASPTARGLASVLGVLTSGFVLGLSGCGGACGPGFGGFLPSALTAWWVGPALLAGAALPVVAVLAWPDRTRELLSLDSRGSSSPWGRAVASVVLAALLAAVTVPALQQGLPEQVDLVRMFGWPILAAAAAAFVALPFLPGRAAHLGASLCAATYPWVVYNPLDSPFWPHRTSVFLGIGLVILLGVATASLIATTRRALANWEPTLPRSWPASKATTLLAAPALVVGLSMGGAVYGATPDGYDSGWYRLYEPCEVDAFEAIADEVEDDPTAFVATGSWQARLVLASVTENASRVQAPHQFLTSESARDQLIGGMEHADREVYVVTDRHLARENPTADTAFLQDEPWTEVGEWCTEGAVRTHPVTLYAYGGTQT